MENACLTFTVIYYSQHQHFPLRRAFTDLSPRCR